MQGLNLYPRPFSSCSLCKTLKVAVGSSSCCVTFFFFLRLSGKIVIICNTAVISLILSAASLVVLTPLSASRDATITAREHSTSLPGDAAARKRGWRAGRDFLRRKQSDKLSLCRCFALLCGCSHRSNRDTDKSFLGFFFIERLRLLFTKGENGGSLAEKMPENNCSLFFISRSRDGWCSCGVASALSNLPYAGLFMWH